MTRRAYAARLCVMIGRCRSASWKSACGYNPSPGYPAMNVKGLAHGDALEQRFRGSMRDALVLRFLCFRIAVDGSPLPDPGALQWALEVSTCYLLECKAYEAPA